MLIHLITRLFSKPSKSKVINGHQSLQNAEKIRISIHNASALGLFFLLTIDIYQNVNPPSLMTLIDQAFLIGRWSCGSAGAGFSQLLARQMFQQWQLTLVSPSNTTELSYRLALTASDLSYEKPQRQIKCSYSVCFFGSLAPSGLEFDVFHKYIFCCCQFFAIYCATFLTSGHVL